MARRPITRKVERTQLDRWREQENLSLKEVGELLGVSAPAVYHWCVGRSLPTLVMAFHIQDATDGAVPASSWLATVLGQHEKVHYETRAGPTAARLLERLKKQTARRALTREYREQLKTRGFNKLDVSVVDGEEVVLTTKAPPRQRGTRVSKGEQKEEELVPLSRKLIWDPGG